MGEIDSGTEDLLHEVISQQRAILSSLATLEERSRSLTEDQVPEMKERLDGHDSRLRQLENGIISLSNLERLPDQIDQLDDELGVLIALDGRVARLESSGLSTKIEFNAEQIARLEKEKNWYAGAIAVITFLFTFFGKAIRGFLGMGG